MHKLTKFFLYAVVADGFLGVAVMLNPFTDSLLGLAAFTVSLAVLLLGFVLFFGMVFTPRLSKRLLLPPILFLGFAMIWSLLFGEKGALPLNLAEALLGLGIIVGYKNPAGASRWDIQDFTGARPLFTAKNFVRTALFNGVIGLFIFSMLALSLTQKARTSIEDATGRFLCIHRDGITLEERRFQRGDREIRLMGMMHIAESGFYDEVARALPSSASAMVLLEGVSDREHRLNGKFDYERVARLFGFTSQKESSFSRMAADGLLESRSNREQGKKPENLEYQLADVDLADFKPETVRFMEIVGKMLSSATLNEALKTYSASRDDLEKNSKNVYDDILNKRNEHLLGEIDKALKTHTMVVVPWGAAHMPVIQQQIENWGFVETKRSQHLVVPFENKSLIALVSLLDWLPDESTNDTQ